MFIDEMVYYNKPSFLWFDKELLKKSCNNKNAIYFDIINI